MAENMTARPEVLELFTRFLRLNPSIPPDSPVIGRVLDAYEAHVPLREQVWTDGTWVPR